jgi:tRNA-modifying protein YgfZ
MATRAPGTLEHDHRVLTEGAGFLERSDRAHLTLRGPDAAEYLQGQVTNDVQALSPGEGCYAALLNPKGRILADMRVIAVAPGELWLDLEAVAHETTLRELTMYKIGRKVEIADAGTERTVLSVIGPRSWEALTRAGIVEGAAPAPEHAWVRGAQDVVVAATDVGFDLLAAAAAVGSLMESLTAAGAQPASEEAAEVVRMEQGRPRYGVDMGDDNLPGEAGIVERAVSFTKGCYVGQEPVARMFHKGHPNRHLRGLLLSAPVETGTPVVAGGKEVGRISSTGVSPSHGPFALAILRREVAPGDEVTAGLDVTAKVVEPPFGPPA